MITPAAVGCKRMLGCRAREHQMAGNGALSEARRLMPYLDLLVWGPTDRFAVVDLDAGGDFVMRDIGQEP